MPNNPTPKTLSKREDNSGWGNCMYYAYSISLMYFLRTQAANVAEGIFTTLQISTEDKSKLTALLKTPGAFTSGDIKQIIEPILGPTTRKLAAEHTKKEYLSNPGDSAIFAAAVYGLEYEFKQKLDANLSILIDNKFDNAVFTTAEVFKVDRMRQSMAAFAQSKKDAVKDKFVAALPTINETIQTQKQTLDKIISDETMLFFKENNGDNLDAYINHLKKDYRWGSEETLFALHRAVTGEKQTHAQTGPAQWDYDVPIKLQIYKDGQPTSENDIPDMILNNEGNWHWTSFILLTEQEKRQLLLANSGFTKYLNLLENKIFALTGKYNGAAEQAKAIYFQLNTQKEEFIKNNVSSQEFSTGCQKIINDAQKELLAPHRGFEPIWNSILNALIAMVSLGAVNLYMGKFRIIEPSKTPSIQIVESLSSSLTKLLQSDNNQDKHDDNQLSSPKPANH